MFSECDTQAESIRICHSTWYVKITKRPALSSGAAIACLFISFIGHARATDFSDAQPTLKDTGLVKQNGLAIFEIDQHLGERLRDISAGDRQMASYLAQRQLIQDDIDKTQDILQSLNRQMSEANAQADQQRNGEAKNHFIAQHNQAVAQVQEGQHYLDKRTAELAALREPTDYIEKAIRLADEMDAAETKYDELAKNSLFIKSLESEKLLPRPIDDVQAESGETSNPPRKVQVGRCEAQHASRSADG